MVPLPQHLALAVTILVHPSTTTRAKTREEKEAAPAALRLLRLISTLVSPRNANFNTAFTFSHFESSRSGRRRHTGDSLSNNEQPDGPNALNLELSQSASLWSRAEDFWHAVGWAFNCSVLSPERWERWRIWLQFMCDVLQDDWAQREQEYDKRKAENETAQPDDSETQLKGEKGKKIQTEGDSDLGILRESIIFQYISGGSITGKTRRIFRAIFADGSTTSRNEFREVFNHELTHPKSNQSADKTNKRGHLDIDRGQYGDYLSEDETDEEGQMMNEGKFLSGVTPSSNTVTNIRQSKRIRRGTRNAADLLTTQPERAAQSRLQTEHNVVDQMGGVTSLSLRKRLVGILSIVADRLPHDFVSNTEFYALLTDTIRHLPLPLFQAFVSPYVLPENSNSAQITLCEFLVYEMIESSAPKMHGESLTQDTLERCFLPFAAASASVVNNAKLSILFEALTVLLATNKLVTLRPSLEEAVDRGILRRTERSKEEPRRGHNGRNKESLERRWLVESGERLIYLLRVLDPKKKPGI